MSEDLVSRFDEIIRTIGEKNAQIKLFNVVRVSGTDEIIRKVLPDKVRGEFRGSLSIIDLALPKTLRTYELSAEADENR